MALALGDQKYSQIERKKEVGTPDFLCDIVEVNICLLWGTAEDGLVT